MKPHEILKKARIDAGYKFAAKFARKIGAEEATYRGHEQGNRRMSPETAQRYAKALGIDWTLLVNGGAPPTATDSPIQQAQHGVHPLPDKSTLEAAILVVEKFVSMNNIPMPITAKAKAIQEAYEVLTEAKEAGVPLDYANSNIIRILRASNE